MMCPSNLLASVWHLPCLLHLTTMSWVSVSMMLEMAAKCLRPCSWLLDRGRAGHRPGPQPPSTRPRPAPRLSCTAHWPDTLCEAGTSRYRPDTEGHTCNTMLGGGVNIDRSKLSWFHLTQHSLAHLVMFYILGFAYGCKLPPRTAKTVFANPKAPPFGFEKIFFFKSPKIIFLAKPFDTHLARGSPNVKKNTHPVFQHISHLWYILMMTHCVRTSNSGGILTFSLSFSEYC